jgi:hypothetical protein
MGKAKPNKGEREMIMDVATNGERDIPRDLLWSVEEVSYDLGVPVGTLYSCRVQRPGMSADRPVSPLSAGGRNGVVRRAG